MIILVAIPIERKPSRKTVDLGSRKGPIDPEQLRQADCYKDLNGNPFTRPMKERIN